MENDNSKIEDAIRCGNCNLLLDIFKDNKIQFSDHYMDLAIEYNQYDIVKYFYYNGINFYIWSFNLIFEYPGPGTKDPDIRIALFILFSKYDSLGFDKSYFINSYKSKCKSFFRGHKKLKLLLYLLDKNGTVKYHLIIF